MKNNFKRNLLIGFGISLVILVINSVFSFVSIRNLIDSSQLVNHTHEVITNLKEINIAFVNAETSQRGYLITGNDQFLEPFRNAEEAVNEYYDKVLSQTKDNNVQQRNLSELRKTLDDRFKMLSARIEEKRQGRALSSEDLMAGKILMDRTNNIVKRMIRNEQDLMLVRTQSADKFSQYSSVLIVVSSLVALLISILFFIRIIRDHAERTKLQEQLEKKDRDTAQRIEIISDVSAQIAKGNFDVRLEESRDDDDLAVISTSLISMASALHTSFNLLKDKEWQQTGIGNLNSLLLAETGKGKDLKALSNEVIAFLAEYTNSQAGAFYVTHKGEMTFQAGYSFLASKENEIVRPGEGLVGEAIVTGKMKELDNLSENDIRISYTMGEVKPGHVVAVPLIDAELNGIFLLAATRQYSPKELEFIRNAADRIAIAITTMVSRIKLQELLEETQSQSEELQAQHNEMENLNSELEAQSQKLQASEEELRVQQEELLQTNGELEERTMLLEERNQEIQRKAEELALSTKYKSEFLANMSHELRTPLNSILLLSRLLSDNNEKNMNSDQVEYAKVIQSSGNGLLGLIDEILDLSKIEAGKMELEFEEVKLNDILDSMKGLFSQVAKEKKIEFIIKPGKDVPSLLETDRTRLEQILKNLISNALKFTANGSVTLETRKSSTADQLDMVVTDTGIGIPKDKQSLIFEAFQQADGSTKRKYGGTGLGLSITRELVRLLGGEIRLKSEEGKGSEFTVTIPLRKSVPLVKDVIISEVPETPEETVVKDENQEKYRSTVIPPNLPDDRKEIREGDKCVLIVEDDVNFAKSLLEYTRKRGYKGIVAVRGDEALPLALKFHPTGILMDIQLPVKSGWEAMSELKNNPATKHIPVHIMSSLSMKKESLLKGAVDFIDKPVAFERMQEIFEKIEYVLSRNPKKVLIIEDNPKHALALSYFLETANINSEVKNNINDSITALKGKDVDCVILDMGIPGNNAYEVLEKVKQNEGFENLPVIVFTGKSLSLAEEQRIKRYADSIVVKTAHSYKRMLDEVSLFLHLVEEKKNTQKGGSFKNLGGMKDVLSGKTVLIADDDVRNIFSLTKALEPLNLKVITAMDGKEAMEKLSENPSVDIVLLDMMMPQMDGYETARKIREQRKWQKLPVIAVTAKAMSGDREKCINAGASDYITKPIDVDQLLSLMRVWLYDKA